jgi:anthranilate/para-aminobenzoate synthase component II
MYDLENRPSQLKIGGFLFVFDGGCSLKRRRLMKVVGIIAKHSEKNNYVSDELRRSLIEVGVSPIAILPPNEVVDFDASPVMGHLSDWETELFLRQLYLCNGIVFQDGNKIGDYEYDIARHAFFNDIPTLGICAGQSVMVAALDGKVTGVEPDFHDMPDEKYVHSCKIIPGTKFASIVEEPTIEVNSRHSMAVSKCPHQLIVSAIDPDGNAEVIEAPRKRFFVGVRFHPESLYKEDEHMLAILKAFVGTLKRPL